MLTSKIQTKIVHILNVNVTLSADRGSAVVGSIRNLSWTRFRRIWTKIVTLFETPSYNTYQQPQRFLRKKFDFCISEKKCRATWNEMFDQYLMQGSSVAGSHLPTYLPTCRLIVRKPVSTFGDIGLWGGLVVSVLYFYSGDPSLNPTKMFGTYSSKLFEMNGNKRIRGRGWTHV